MEKDLAEILEFTTEERNIFDKEQNIYSIIKTMEYLEWAYMSGKIPGTEYDMEFKQLLHQFNQNQSTMKDFIGVEAFFKKYELEHCVTAKQRIIEQKGGYAGEETKASMAVRVMDIT